MTAVIAETVTRPVPPPLTSNPLDVMCDVKTLRDALTFVSAALPTRPPMQVLLGITIRAAANGISLSAFDYETAVTETINGVGVGEALVPGKLLLDIVKALDPGPASMVVNGTHLDVIQGDLVLSLPLLPMADYPQLPNVSKAKEIGVCTGADLNQLYRVAVAAAREETLPILTSLRLENEDGHLRAAATDRYRLAVADTQVKTRLPVGLNVPARAFAFAVKHLGKADSVTLKMLGDVKKDDLINGQIVFTTGSRTITRRLLEGDFPRYRSLIPTDLPISITGKAAELSKAIKQVALVAARNAPVRLDLTPQGVTLRAGGEGDAKASKALNVTVAGVQDLEFAAYNPIYLLDAIEAVGKSGTIQLALTNGRKPAIITEPGSGDFLYLLMPVRLSG